MRIAVIGTGFSGVAVACQLLARLPAGSELTLFNASGNMARGLAYGTQSDEHQLNVPAARMSLYPQDPAHFQRWLQAQGEAGEGHEFVPRQRYGQYLQACLNEAEARAPAVRLHTVIAAVEALVPLPDGPQHELLVRFPGGERSTQCFDRVVLALGHFAPRAPLPALAQLPDGLYVNDPWSATAFDGLATDAPVALIGSGLTMLDLLLSLRQRGHQGPLLALSRRGLQPLGHRANELPPPNWPLPESLTAQTDRLRPMLRLFRAEVERAQQLGRDWRDVLGSFRPHTAPCWQRLSRADRERFLRHLQPYWDVHRHRAAPSAIAVLEQARASAQLRTVAGRLQGVEHLGAQRARLSWCQRGSAAIGSFDAARIINCSGPSAGSRSGFDAERSPLLAQLQASGRLQACPMGLGLMVEPGSLQLLDAQGQVQPGLYYLGPLLKAQHWEATAVPELRVFAERLALHCAA